LKQALAIDAAMGTTFWKDAIEKEMKNVQPACEFRDNDVMPVGYKKIDCHMVFDIKPDLVHQAVCGWQSSNGSTEGNGVLPASSPMIRCILKH
jgi:hypothetical protein